ncbi:Killer toxin subunits alpha/beta [Penicillium oxalicum]|uniref:Killer toxin subunits alpha/beta n=1 Tax=Penicillium oxalicum TaxID=69781 RepID=UPI0020B8DC27|nr:Killer toxin subunits alpha/beta [Penicillium oxalicum]KAI2792815.1 Killer toxin subunits alpha/beta [Penicillium oxalicum]
MKYVQRAFVLGLASGLVHASQFDPQIEPCPQACSIAGPDSANWTSYHSLDRLRLCKKPLHFDFNYFSPLDSHTTTKACTLDAAKPDVAETQLSCSGGADKPMDLQVSSWDTSSSDAVAVASVSEVIAALRSQIADSHRSCNNSVAPAASPTVLFASYGDLLAGLYIGSNIDAADATRELSKAVLDASAGSGLGEAKMAQICGANLTSAHTLGLIATRTGSAHLLHQAMQSWTNATCTEGSHQSTKSKMTVVQLPSTVGGSEAADNGLKSRAGTCTYKLVVSGDSCGSLATKCGITATDLYKYNPSSTFCSTLAVGQPICCSAGSLPDLKPKPNADGTCHSYTVQSGDYCALLATKNYITVENIESYNSKTWGWQGCSNLQRGTAICLSSGEPPMPAIVPGTACGPQKAGTTRPENWDDLSGLNPCPLNACCDIWGQCGITSDYCTVSNSSTGAPGTAAPGENGCISNCGTDIVAGSSSVSQRFNIGYFEAFGVDRSCLAMDASQLPSSYSHVHFAFGQVSSTFDVTLDGYQDQFERFSNMTYFKRVLSFGGWSFSTDLDSYPIFREGVTAANRLTFAQNVVAFVERYNLDGVDFDWEYPGAPDIPGIPPGSPTDGANYLSFLKTVRSLLPSGKTLSIAAPASYWYLKGFPIAEMSKVVDYIVYMTYDLHGQWDYNSPFANPGCELGNCLRSHVNLTETESALSMITKAGVPANKVVVGIASYGRSFGMMDPSCTGPNCLFTGPNSTATPGECTDTAGYISQAELERMLSDSARLRRRDVTSWYDKDTDSDMMTYGGGSWVAYMSQKTKISRINRYAAYGFAGAVEWALDLAQFVLGSGDDSVSAGEIEENKQIFTEALNSSNYDTSEFSTYNLTDLATRLVGYDGCSRDQKNQIYSGWQQSWKIMNQLYQEANSGFNFNEAAALEFLGAPAYTKPFQDRVQQAFKQLGTIQPGWSGIFAWKLAVRCDDLYKACPCGNGNGQTIAYTVQKDAKYQTAAINFCDPYFEQDTLDAKIAIYAQPKKAVEYYADMDHYASNQGSTWIHELLHVDWASLKGDPHIYDIKIAVQANDRTKIWTKAYGPVINKALGRMLYSGFWTMQNADSMSLYALARYVQKKLGNIYPHLPLALKPAVDADWPYLVSGLEVYENGTGISTSGSDGDVSTWSSTTSQCSDSDDLDGGWQNQATMTVSGFPMRSDYPADYLSSWSSWAGLTPTTTTTDTPTATPSGTWEISIYSQADCKGDHYEVMGHDINSPLKPCLVISDLGTTDTATSNSCRWYSGGSWESCDKSSLTHPLSWKLKSPGDSCTAYDNAKCERNGSEQSYSTVAGACNNYDKADFDQVKWIALRCGWEP